jgi:hypothetical protein
MIGAERSATAVRGMTTMECRLRSQAHFFKFLAFISKQVSRGWFGGGLVGVAAHVGLAVDQEACASPR